MNTPTERRLIDGPAGVLEVAIDRPDQPPRGLAVVAHPHPLHGGTMDNKVVQTLSRSHVLTGFEVWRFNVRGVGGSAGQWDGGVGEQDDFRAVLKAARSHRPALALPERLALAGFSFGCHLASTVATELKAAGEPLVSTVLVGPAVVNFRVDPPAGGGLIIHGSDDEVVALDAVIAWARPQVLPLLVLPGVGHFFHGHLPLLRQCVRRHLETLAE